MYLHSPVTIIAELSDRVEETDAVCQTDAFLDRPPSPMFIPAKTGKDTETQIYDGDVCMGVLRGYYYSLRPIYEQGPVITLSFLPLSTLTIATSYALPM